MRDADDPTRLRRARNEAELEARVDTAIEAWRELGPDGTGRFAEDDLLSDEHGQTFSDGRLDSAVVDHPLSFVDRVMAAEETRVQARVVDVPTVAAVPARRGTRWKLGGLGLVAAGLLAVLSVGPWSSPSLDVPT